MCASYIGWCASSGISTDPTRKIVLPMNETMYQYFEKEPTARTLYYRQKSEELERARETLAFIDEARKSGLSLTFGVAVDAWVCPCQIDLGNEQGQDLVMYLLDWTAGVGHRIQAELDEMLAAWPLLSERTEIGPQNVPEGP